MMINLAGNLVGLFVKGDHSLVLALEKKPLDLHNVKKI